MLPRIRIFRNRVASTILLRGSIQLAVICLMRESPSVFYYRALTEQRTHHYHGGTKPKHARKDPRGLTGDDVAYMLLHEGVDIRGFRLQKLKSFDCRANEGLVSTDGYSIVHVLLAEECPRYTKRDDRPSTECNEHDLSPGVWGRLDRMADE